MDEGRGGGPESGQVRARLKHSPHPRDAEVLNRDVKQIGVEPGRPEVLVHRVELGLGPEPATFVADPASRGLHHRHAVGLGQPDGKHLAEGGTLTPVGDVAHTHQAVDELRGLGVQRYRTVVGIAGRHEIRIGALGEDDVASVTPVSICLIREIALDILRQLGVGERRVAGGLEDAVGGFRVELEPAAQHVEIPDHLVDAEGEEILAAGVATNWNQHLVVERTELVRDAGGLTLVGQAALFGPLRFGEPQGIGYFGVLGRVVVGLERLTIGWGLVELFVEDELVRLLNFGRGLVSGQRATGGVVGVDAGGRCRGGGRRGLSSLRLAGGPDIALLETAQGVHDVHGTHGAGYFDAVLLRDSHKVASHHRGDAPGVHAGDEVRRLRRHGSPGGGRCRGGGGGRCRGGGGGRCRGGGRRGLRSLLGSLLRSLLRGLLGSLLRSLLRGLLASRWSRRRQWGRRRLGRQVPRTRNHAVFFKGVGLEDVLHRVQERNRGSVSKSS